MRFMLSPLLCLLGRCSEPVQRAIRHPPSAPGIV